MGAFEAPGFIVARRGKPLFGRKKAWRLARLFCLPHYYGLVTSFSAFFAVFFAGAFFAAFLAGAFLAAFFAAFLTAKGVPLLVGFLLLAPFFTDADFFAAFLPLAPLLLFFAADFFDGLFGRNFDFLCWTFFAGTFFAAFFSGSFRVFGRGFLCGFFRWSLPSRSLFGGAFFAAFFAGDFATAGFGVGGGVERLVYSAYATGCAPRRRHRCHRRRKRGKLTLLPLLRRSCLPYLPGRLPSPVQSRCRCAREICDHPASKLPSGLKP